MYNFFLGIFVFVSFCLVFLIMIQNGKNSDVNTGFNLIKSKQIITFCNNSMLIRITGIFAFLFFLISLIICNISYNNVL